MPIRPSRSFSGPKPARLSTSPRPRKRPLRLRAAPSPRPPHPTARGRASAPGGGDPRRCGPLWEKDTRPRRARPPLRGDAWALDRVPLQHGRSSGCPPRGRTLPRSLPGKHVVGGLAEVGLRSVKLTAFAASVAVLMATGGAARAQGAPPGGAVVAVVASRCNDVPWSVGAWVEILRAELAGDGVRVQPSDAAGTAATHQVTVEPERCDSAVSAATLTFSSGDLRKTRTLTLADVDPAARARVLAIAVADLVRQGVAAARTAQPLSLPPSPPIHARIRPHPPSPDP